MMKKYLSAMLIAAAVFCGYSASAEIVITLDEEAMSFSVPPVIINDRTMVPLRSIFEALGAYVDWDNNTKTVTAQRRFDKISLTVGENTFTVNGEQKALDAPAVIVDDRTMIPVRAVAEALGAEVVWNATTKTVAISSNAGEHKIYDIYLDFWETNPEDEVVLTGRIAYPEIVEPANEITTAFNEFILADAEESADKFLVENLERAILEQAENGSDFYPYMYEQCFDITYDKNGIISMRCLENSFLNGTQSPRNMFAVNFSLKDGKILSVSDVLKNSETEIRKIVYNEFRKLIDSQAGDFYSDAYDCLDSALSKLNWYIAEDGVHFFVNSNKISNELAEIVVKQ